MLSTQGVAKDCLLFVVLKDSFVLEIKFVRTSLGDDCGRGDDDSELDTFDKPGFLFAGRKNV